LAVALKPAKLGSMKGKILLAAVGLALLLNGAALPGDAGAATHKPAHPAHHLKAKKAKARK
jgi:hypothetical protein